MTDVESEITISVFGVRSGMTNLGGGMGVLVLVEWCLVRFHVKVRLLERSWPVRIVGREETTSLSPFAAVSASEGIRKMAN